ncbi:MAG: hypothetical protein NTY77_04455 [Elusimicrobia bacterium]|nr:hypothetical protein [Elusimicrobiota bacterium]
MDQTRRLQQAQQTLDDFTTKLKATHARCDEIQARAQRLEAWYKNQTSLKVRPPDRDFPDDLKLLRRDIKTIIRDFEFVPAWLAKVERTTEVQPDAVDAAIKVSRSGSQFQQEVLTLLAPIQMTYNHIKIAEIKIDAWFLAQEIEAWAKETVAIPLRVHKILLKINPLDKTPPPRGTEGVVLPEAPEGLPEDLEGPDSPRNRKKDEPPDPAR